MKRYIYTLFIGALLSLTSCVMDDPFVNGGMPTPTPNGNSGIQIIGAAEDFDLKLVGTRADDEGVADSYISEMTMLIFGKDGKMLPAFNANKEPLPSSHINIRRSNPTFLINTSEYNGTGILASMEAGVTIKYYDNKAENNDNISACSIYIVANAYHLIGDRLEAGEINTKDKLEAALLAVDNLNMPYNEETGEYIGLPMIGCARDEETKQPATFDLRYKTGDNTNNAVATIPLKKLYSKVSFSIQVNSKQLVTGQVPEFKLTNVEVYNVPSEVRMTYQEGNYIENHGNKYLYMYSVEQPSPFSFVANGMMPKDVVCRHSTSEDTDDVVSFHFYMPEHKVTPEYTETTYPYPANLPPENRQHFKPKLIEGKIATFVRIHGSYTDHNGNIHDIKYDIYLGQDNTDDFTIMRNQHLHNRLIINGITNHKDAYGGDENTISIDHRVSMTSKGYNLSIERETLLDSHFEVRPLDIELQPGSSMTIVIDESDKSWVAMENDAAANDANVYASTEFRKGIRKYFTTGLVNELNGTIGKGNGGSITIRHSGTAEKEYFRIWFYIDENPHVYDLLLDEGKITESPNGDGSYNVNDNINETDKRSRVAKVYFYFAKEGDPDLTKTPNTILNFQQWNLWRVWSQPNDSGVRERFYDIEHEEEYLYNFASNDQYGQTNEEGMPWGLPDVQLSNVHNSFYIDENNTEWNDYVKNTPLLKYDFYIGKYDTFVDDNIAVHGYAGQHFTKEIAENPNANINIKVLTLEKQASGAVEYCYNRNKRKSDGSVAEVEWYLPSVDEMEDFIVAGYSSFKEFQDHYYWTSQPAYIRNAFYYEYRNYSNDRNPVDAYAFVAYEDNTNYARATKVKGLGNDQYDYTKSGLNKTPKETHAMDNNCISNGAEVLDGSYFNVMYGWYRLGNNTSTKTMKADEHFWAWRDGVDTKKRYHVHLGHLYDMTQDGYHLRTKSNRVRCARRDWNPDNYYEMVPVYKVVKDTPVTSLDNSGNTMYVMRNTNYSNTYLTTSGDNVAASSSTDVSIDNIVVIVDNKIKSVAKNQYFSGYNGNVSLANSGTSYTISNGSDFTISYTRYSTTYYLKQTNNGVSMSSGNNGHNTWNFYEVKKEYVVK